MSPLVTDQFKRATGKRVTALDGVVQQVADGAGQSRGTAVRNTDSRPTGHRQFRHSADTLSLTASTCGTPP